MSENQIGFAKALPFYLVFLNIPVLAWVVSTGGWSILIGYIYFLCMFSLGDLIFGMNKENLDPTTEDKQLFWYTLSTKIWPIAQFALIFFAIYILKVKDYPLWQRFFMMALVGMSSGIAGIVIAHELVHQQNRLERTLGDLLLGMVWYGHFRTEHIFGHHRYVATPRDPVTARYNESIYRFFLRAIPESIISAWKIEKDFCKKRKRPLWHISNPFYIYCGLAFAFTFLAFLIGGWHGVMQFAMQAVTAILLVETTNYIEHYGLVRQHLGDGKYEHVQPRHSWNANHRITNYLMINLQRHSDHHYKPQRRFPLLQALDETDAPQLPHGYIMMAIYAYTPFHWRKVMNPRVRRWRSMYYPQITDWTDYNKGATPWPR